VVRAANRRLESHQRISGFSSWTHDGLPRTEATGKIKRREVRRWVEAGGRGPAPDLVAPDDTLKLLERYLGGQPAGPQTRLDELGLTSLDRVELLAALEERTHATISETSLDEAQTIEDLRRLLQRGGEPAPEARPIVFPSWNRWRLAAVLRNLSQQTWILPLSRVFLSLRVEGLERLSTLRGPVVFAANHQSHLDTPAVLAALPAPWRRTIAVPMWKEYFDPHFLPERFPLRRRLANSAIYFLTALFFNGFPLPQQGPGTRQTLRYIGGLVSDGCSLLIFPEGERTRRGEIGTFAAGVGLIASRLQVPVVPVRLEGVHRVLHRDWRWPRRGTVHVIFGAPLALEGADYAGLARQVEDAVRALGPRRPGALLQTPTAA
jgi:long-chain acyl-CoA synthetase